MKIFENSYFIRKVIIFQKKNYNKRARSITRKEKWNKRKLSHI